MRYVFHVVETLPWLTGTICAVLIFILFSITGIFLIRKIIPREKLKAHHDVVGFVFTNIGVLYSVLLGFTVVNAQQRFDRIKETSQMEAIYLAELYKDAAVFEDHDKLLIRSGLRDYANSVIHDEWKSLSKGKMSDYTSLVMHKVWQAYYNVNLTNNLQNIWYTESIGKLNSLTSTRISRLLGGEESLGAEMWSILIFGAIVIVSFVWFFGMESITTHMMMAVILSSTIAFLLFLIYSLDTVFTGDLSIKPEAMQKIAQAFKHYDSLQDVSK